MNIENYKTGTTTNYNCIMVDERISFTEKAVLNLLISFTKGNVSKGKGISIVLSNSDLMEMLPMGHSTIQRSKQHLQELGLLTVCNTKSDGVNNKSIITLNQSFINTFFGMSIFKTESESDTQPKQKEEKVIQHPRTRNDHERAMEELKKLFLN